MSDPTESRGRFSEGDTVLLHDRRRRRYRIQLEAGASYHLHLGAVRHDDLIGAHEGTVVVTSGGHHLLALRPTFAERVLDLPRQSQVIYPKDLGAILMRGDIFPGARVVEIGLGSGATAAAVLRAIGPEGTLISYEIRQEVIGAAKKNVEELAPRSSNHTIRLQDPSQSGLIERHVDRVYTDVPEPWVMLGAIAEALRPGGLYLGYLPTVLQVHRLCAELEADHRWLLVETVEILERPWHVSGRSARPEHRMVGHTGFITTARRCDPLATDPEIDGRNEASSIDL